MSYWFLSFFAGFLTVLAPCSLFLLPTIVVGSASQKNPMRPWIVTLSLGISVFFFSLIVKGTSLAFVLPDSFWSGISGILLILFGLSLFFPHAWEYIVNVCHLRKSQNWLEGSNRREGPWGAILLGASLGPVFSTCSPTFAILLATILPGSFLQGTINIALFVVGMMIPFLLIGISGQRVVKRFRFAANPNGWFRKSLGIILVSVGIMIMTGFQKSVEVALIERGYLGPISLEQALLEDQESTQKDESTIDLAIQDRFSSFKTDLSQHSISFDKILSGGPGKDGIPALNDPQFISIEQAPFNTDSLGIFVNINGDKRYYPFNILVWHEIVNDTVGGKPIAITFCPLCGSAIVFDRMLDDKLLDFGVSGFLYESNLLMYDRQTESFWSQAKGEAVVGSYIGTKLERIEMQRLPFGELKEKYPLAKILSPQTGYSRNYSSMPYGNYDESDVLFFPISMQDQRFPAKEMMLVVPVQDTWVAFPWLTLRENGEAEIMVNNKKLSLFLDGSETSIAYEGASLPSYFEMWFSFAIHHQKDGLVWDGS